MFFAGENQTEVAGRGGGALHGPGEGRCGDVLWERCSAMKFFVVVFERMFPVPGQQLRSGAGQEAEDPGEAARGLEAEVRGAGGRGGGLPEGEQATRQRALQTQDGPRRVSGAAGGRAQGEQGLPGYENTHTVWSGG